MNLDNFYHLEYLGGCYRGVMVKAVDIEIVVCEFEIQSRYYVHFWTNTPLVLPAIG